MSYLRKINNVDVYGPSQNLINSSFSGNLNVAVNNVETILSSVLIPQNTFTTGDCVSISSRIVKTGSTATTVIRLRIGTSGSVSDTLIGSYTASTSSHTIIPIWRTLCLIDSNTSVFDPNITRSFDNSSTNGTINVQINWQATNTLSVSAFNTTAVSNNVNVMFIKTKMI
jgi:hypothetical protein